MVSEIPQTCVVKFWAQWCGPCKALNPVVDKVAAETGVEVVHVNVDEQPDLAAQYGVRSIPAMFGMRDGQIVSTMVGARGEPAVLELFKAVMADKAGGQ